MKNGLHPLLAAASLIVVLAGLRAAAPILNLFVLALLLTTSVAPVVLWQLRKGWSTNRAVLLTVLGVVLGGVLTVFLVGVSVARLARKLPAYESRLAEVRDSLASALSARGVDLPDPRTIEALSPQKLVGYAASVLGALGSAFNDAILILLLVVFMLAEGAEKRFKYDQGLLPADSWWAQFYGSGADVRKYVSITAFTGFLGAIANFILMLVLGVDGVALWAFLSFLFNFIPNFGFILSVIPPALLALLEFGPGRAMIVVVGFIVVNAVVENVLKPRFIGQELELSALEVFLSLLFWGWVLGAVGAIVAVPLTILVKRVIPVIAAGISVPAAPSHSR